MHSIYIFKKNLFLFFILFFQIPIFCATKYISQNASHALKIFKQKFIEQNKKKLAIGTIVGAGGLILSQKIIREILLYYINGYEKKIGDFFNAIIPTHYPNTDKILQIINTSLPNNKLEKIINRAISYNTRLNISNYKKYGYIPQKYVKNFDRPLSLRELFLLTNDLKKITTQLNETWINNLIKNQKEDFINKNKDIKMASLEEEKKTIVPLKESIDNNLEKLKEVTGIKSMFSLIFLTEPLFESLLKNASKNEDKFSIFVSMLTLIKYNKRSYYNSITLNELKLLNENLKKVVKMKNEEWFKKAIEKVTDGYSDSIVYKKSDLKPKA